MPVTWISTSYPGVRYYEHASRRHGVGKDRYFAIRAQVHGSRREEGLGWASEGWTAAKAAQVIAELKKAHTTGEGAQTLAEKRAMAEEKRQAAQEAQALVERESLTFGQFFEDTYFPQAQIGKRPGTLNAEIILYRKWLAPEIGNMRLIDLVPFHVEKVKNKMLKAGKTPKTTQYAMAVIRQAWNLANRDGFVHGDNPVSKVKKPSTDNRRLRFLTKDEAERLLAALAEKSIDVRDMALLSLHTGMRAGEIFGLTWADVDFEREVLTIKDTKSGRTRAAIMTQAVKGMLAGRERNGAGLVFPGGRGGRIVQISDSFNKVVAALGFNDDIADRRQKVVFHSLRHTFASWLVEQGVDLYTVKELMGHADFKMTSRYAHLAPDTLRRAVRMLERSLESKKQVVVVGFSQGRPAI